MSRRVLPTVLALGLIGGILAATPASATESHQRPVRLLGEQIVPNSLLFQGTVVGGLSSIDYDPRTGGYALICDDPPAVNPAPLSTATFPVSADRVGPGTFTGTKPPLRPDGPPPPP